MSFAESLASTRGGPKVLQVLATVPEPERAEMLAAIKDPAWSATQIARAMTKEGYPIDADAVRRHPEYALERADS